MYQSIFEIRDENYGMLSLRIKGGDTIKKHQSMLRREYVLAKKTIKDKQSRINTSKSIEMILRSIEHNVTVPENGLIIYASHAKHIFNIIIPEKRIEMPLYIADVAFHNFL